jgi:hypothetical protein
VVVGRVTVVSEVHAARWFIADVGSIPWSLHHMDKGIIADISGLHAACIPRVKVSGVNECSWSGPTPPTREGGGGASSHPGPVLTVDRGELSNGSS